MAEIIIGNAPRAYRSYLRTADNAGNRNGRIDSSNEAVSAAKRFYRAHPTWFGRYHKFLMYIEGKGFKLRPRLADEGTVPLRHVLVRPRGRKRTLLYTRANYSFDLTGNASSANNRDNHHRRIDWCKTGYATLRACLPYLQGHNGGISIPLYLYRHSSRHKREPAPVISGLGYRYTTLWKDVTDATHIEVDVKLMTTRWNPRTRGYIIVEIYDADNRTTSVRRSKNRRNRWLPRRDVDLFKVRIPISSTGRWQTLIIPLSRFIDWNRKRAAIRIPEPGVNETIGDGRLNLKRGESFQVQVILEADGYDRRFGAYVGEYIRLVKYY